MENPERKPKILVVDDSSFEIELVDWILQENNYQTVLANNGSEALEIIKIKDKI